MLDIDQKHLDKITGILKVIFGPNIDIYAYGSRVKNTDRPSSDLDLMIKKGDEKLNIYDILEAKELLDAASLPFRVDPHDYNATDSSFISKVEDSFVKL